MPAAADLHTHKARAELHACRIVRLLALSLGLPADFFREHFTQPIASLRPLHYTAAVSAPDEVRSWGFCFFFFFFFFFLGYEVWE